MAYVLRKDGRDVKIFSTREQCAVEAFERGWVVTMRGLNLLVSGVEIMEDSWGRQPAALKDSQEAGRHGE